MRSGRVPVGLAEVVLAGQTTAIAAVFARVTGGSIEGGVGDATASAWVTLLTLVGANYVLAGTGALSVAAVAIGTAPARDSSIATIVPWPPAFLANVVAGVWDANALAVGTDIVVPGASAAINIATTPVGPLVALLAYLLAGLWLATALTVDAQLLVAASTAVHSSTTPIPPGVTALPELLAALGDAVEYALTVGATTALITIAAAFVAFRIGTAFGNGTVRLAEDLYAAGFQ